MKIRSKPTGRLKLLPGLDETLGFLPNEFVNNEDPLHDSPYKNLEDNIVADPNFYLKLLYVYSDIAEPQIVGHMVALLLRVI